MDYKYFDVEDFIQNPFFVDWVKKPNEELDHFWINWMNRHPEKRHEVQLAIEIIKSVNYEVNYTLSSDEYNEMMDRVLQHQEPISSGNRLLSFYRSPYRIAASVVILLASVLGIHFYFQMSSTSKVDSVPLESQWVKAATEYGQKRTLFLADGTKVILNSGSQLEYPADFGKTERMVRFTGEAFFEVAHNPEKPFFIESNTITTKVLGTSFNLRVMEEEEEASVSVVTGRVEVKTKTGKVALLHKNDQGVFHRLKNDLSKRTFDAETLTAWTRGTLIFEEESLPSIFSKLEKWYGVKFQISDQVQLTGKYSGVYKRKSLELVLEGLSYTSNFNYKINQKTITIYDKNMTN